jgi:hypothetical protein
MKIAAVLAATLLAACSPPPEQPDLNTYGAIQPLCVLGCRQTLTLTEGDGAVGTLTTEVSQQEGSTSLGTSK